MKNIDEIKSNNRSDKGFVTEIFLELIGLTSEKRDSSRQ